MKSTSFALLAVIMSTVVLAGCMGTKTTEEVMVDTGVVVDTVVTTEVVVPTNTTNSGTETIVMSGDESMSGDAEVVNQVVNEVTTAQ